MTIILYTDGACKTDKIVKFRPGQRTGTKPEALGRGGWAWWVDDDMCDSGAVPMTTNNRMEMLAVIKALSAMTIEHPFDRLLIVSDSAYVVNCFAQGWHEKWAKNGWTASGGKEVKNRDLWEEMIHLWASHQNAVAFRHCRGHGRGGPEDAPYVHGNDKADKLAVAARLTLERGN